MWQRFKRWLYVGERPGRIASGLNRAFAALHGAGVGPASWVVLEVVGRKSGRTISFPLVMVTLEGERFLVSMLGNDAAWVHNVAAARGAAVLRRGAREAVQLEPVPVAQRPPILREYLHAAPGARPHVRVARDAPLAALEAIAGDFPVFRVTRRA